MIKLTFICFFLVFYISCSSTGEKDYKKNDVEGRADDHSAMGDRFRNERKYQDAFNYYQTASDLYLLKGSNDKYILTKLKQCLLLLKENKESEFNILIDKLKIFNEIENLGLNRQIKYMEARYLYQKGDVSKGNKIIEQLIGEYNSSEEFEQKTYYQFYFVSKNINKISIKKIQRLDDSLDDLNDLYDGGKLQNIEVLTFSMRTLSQLYLANSMYEKAKKMIEKTDKLYLDLELTSKRDQILKLYINLYKGLKDTNKIEYYNGLLKRFLLLMKKYS
jgi:hypothetical protein